MSKDFLEKMDVNSIRYSGIGGDCALELALKASARHWEMVDDAPIVMDGKASACLSHRQQRWFSLSGSHNGGLD